MCGKIVAKGGSYMKLRLFLYLKQNKISVDTMSRKIGCTRPHLSKIIHGRVTISNMIALAIEKATNGEITKEYLLGDES